MQAQICRFAIIMLAAAALAGCASGVTRQSDSGTPQRMTGERIADVTVRLSADAQARLPDKAGFSAADLTGRIRDELKKRNVLDASSPVVLDVEVTGLHLRSTFAAVMFGFMAGNDSLTGAVRLRRPGGTSESFTVSASYALGGLAGGQDANRMGWLYEEFARLTVNELFGDAAAREGK